jgi:hypothetical protein
MITQEVSNRYYELIQMHQYEQIQNELYIPDAVSIEPVVSTFFFSMMTGMDFTMRKLKMEYFKKLG